MYNAIINIFHILSNIIYFRWKEALGVHFRHRKRHHVAVYNMVLRWNLQGCVEHPLRPAIHRCGPLCCWAAHTLPLCPTARQGKFLKFLCIRHFVIRHYVVRHIDVRHYVVLIKKIRTKYLTT